MSNAIVFDYSTAKRFISENELQQMEQQMLSVKSELLQGACPGNDFLGWMDLPVNFDKEELQKIKQAAKKVQDHSEAFVVIGIGGSYLGARAAITCLHHNFYNELPKEQRKTPEIYYVGNQISTSYLNDLVDLLRNKSFSINVISKSGTTTEPAIAFRVLRRLLIEKYGEKEAASRIYATTDSKRGALKQMALQEGYETFVIPDDVGGRYSVFTAVGLLPMAVSGIDIERFLEGAALQREDCLNQPFQQNGAMQYAAVRNILLRKGKQIEILANYEPSLHYIAEWWKQLFGESEGKDQKGLFPASVDFTTDLHSMGQFIQDGQRNLFETVLKVKHPKGERYLEAEEKDLDGLNYLSGKSLHFINQNAMNGTILAHTDGNVPNIIIELEEQTEYDLGKLFYFFEFACAISGLLLGVNPFNQPGVEAYKKNMFALLGKKGFEQEKEELQKRLER